MHSNLSQRIPLPLRVWDILVWLAIVAPLVSGGVQIRGDGFRFELAQINVQVFALAFLGWLLQKYAGCDWQQASSIRLLARLWKWWCDSLQRRPVRTLSLAVVLQTVLWAGSATSRHHGFHSAAADMGIFMNGIWNFVNGNGLISAGKSGAHLFTDHQSPIIYLVAPFFWLIPRVETVLVLQALALVSAGTALFYLALQYKKIPFHLAALAPWLLWLYHPLRSANRFDFHPETLMLPFFLWAIVLLQSPGRWARGFGFLFFLIGLGGKESAGPLGVGIAMAWLLGAAPEASRRFTRRIAAPLAILGVAVFVFETTQVPKLFGRAYAYQDAYAHFGRSTLDVVLAPFVQPKFFFAYLFQRDRIHFFFASILPLAFLPLIGWRAFAAALPNYLVLLLSVGSQRISLGYQYSVELAPGIFWGALLALENLGARGWRLPLLPQFLRTKRERSSEPNQHETHLRQNLSGLRWPPDLLSSLALSPQIMFCVLLLFSLGTYGRGDLYYWRHYPLDAHQKWLKQEFFPALTQAPIIAPRSYVPHLSLRPWAHFLPILEITEGSGRYVDCVIVDDAVPLPPDERASTLAKLAELGYRERYRCGSLFLLEKPQGEACLAREPLCSRI